MLRVQILVVLVETILEMVLGFGHFRRLSWDGSHKSD